MKLPRRLQFVLLATLESILPLSVQLLVPRAQQERISRMIKLTLPSTILQMIVFRVWLGGIRLTLLSLNTVINAKDRTVLLLELLLTLAILASLVKVTMKTPRLVFHALRVGTTHLPEELALLAGKGRLLLLLVLRLNPCVSRVKLERPTTLKETRLVAIASRALHRRLLGILTAPLV